MSGIRTQVEGTAVAAFLAGRRVALVGASEDQKHFSVTVDAALTSHGYDVVPVNPHHESFGSHHCYPNVSDIPGGVDGALIEARP